MLNTFKSEWQATNQYNLSCLLLVFILPGLVTWSGITWRVLLKHGKENGTKKLNETGKYARYVRFTWLVREIGCWYLFVCRCLTTTPGSINHGDYRSVERGVTKTRNGNWNGIKRKTMQYDVYLCNTYTCIYKYNLFVRITPLSFWRRSCTIYIHCKLRWKFYGVCVSSLFTQMNMIDKYDMIINIGTVDASTEEMFPTDFLVIMSRSNFYC